MNSFLLPSNLILGPESSLEASTLSSLNDDNVRAKTASPINVKGTPRSREAMPVHLPVPFCPAVSSILSTSGLPSSSLNAKMSRVISMR